MLYAKSQKKNKIESQLQKFDDITWDRNKIWMSVEWWEIRPVEINRKNVIFSGVRREVTSARRKKFKENRRNKSFVKPPK